ncbi:Uncharacterised protein [Segatella copri]|nr:Uncharacterised protein [Segatella copri]
MVGSSFTRVQVGAVCIIRGDVVGTTGKLIDTHTIEINTPDIVILKLQFLVSTRYQVVNTFLSLEISRTFLSNQLLVKERITTRSNSS